MQKADINGTTIAYKIDQARDNSGDAEWIILSNSLAANHRMWDPQVDLLTGKYRLLRYDTRGHGDSPPVEGPYSFDMLISDVTGLMDHLHIQKASFMGLSLGGMTSLGLALNHANRFDRLVCCDARADSPPSYVDSWNERIAAVEAGGIASIVDGTLERWLVQSFREANPDQVEFVRDMINKTTPAGWIGCAEALKTLDYLKDLGRISLPVLYVVGAEDAGAPPEVMKHMANSTPGANFVVIPNAAHVANIDNSKGFNDAISPFLGLS